jgi:hypothetical protein
MRNLSASISADETVLTLEVVGEQLSSGEVIDVLVTSSGSRRIEIRSSVVATPDGSVSWATSLPRIEGEISLVASCPQSPSGCSATASFLETGEDAG